MSRVLERQAARRIEPASAKRPALHTLADGNGTAPQFDENDPAAKDNPGG